MSSAMKGIVIRSTADVCKQGLFKGKYTDHHHYFDLVRENRSFLGARPRCVRRLGVARCVTEEYPRSNGKKLSSSKQRKVETVAEAILTPVSDPTRTMEKVYSFFFFSYQLRLHAKLSS